MARFLVWTGGVLFVCLLVLGLSGVLQELRNDMWPSEIVAESPQDAEVSPEKSLPSPTPEPVEPTPTPDPIKAEAIRKLGLLGQQPTPESLFNAIRERSPYSVDLCLKAGVSANATDEKGNPALLVACENDRRAEVARLLAGGADPNGSNMQTASGKTPLMVAASQGNLVLLDALLQAGATLNRVDAHGHSAIHFAVFARSASAINWLLEKGGPAEEMCCDGKQSLLSHALDTWDAALIGPILEAERKLHPLNWSHSTIAELYGAVRLGDKLLTRALLANHAQPPTPEGFRQPLIGYAIAWGDAASLAFLLECGADPNTPLGSPVERAFSRLVHDENTAFYLQKEGGMTPLMLAAGIGRLDCVNLLLHYGARRGALTSRSKMAAVMFAAHGQNAEIMQVLLGKSPRPEDQRTRIEISLSGQRAVLVKNEQVALISPISTGRTGFPTPAGRFVVTDKEPLRHSSIYKVDMPFFMRLNCSEVGMHAGEVPNYPASHGCIRLPRQVAIRFFKEVDIGTLVTIRP